MRSRKTMLNGSAGPLLRWRKRSEAFVRASAAKLSRILMRRRSRRAKTVSAVSRPAATEPLLDARRRAFLKYAAFGGALFVAGRYIDPLINTVRGDKVLSEKVFDNFKVTETGKKLLVTDDDGEEILTIDKETF